MGRTERTIKLPSGELKYFVQGEGRPLLYLHWSAGVAWTPVLEGLAASHALHVPVIPGYDGTPRHGGIADMPALAQVVAAFIEETFNEPVDIVGHSFGGRLALWLAAQRPELVDHLVLECPSGFAPEGSFPRDTDTLRKRMFAHPEKRPAERSPHIAANGETTAIYLQGKTFDTALQERIASIDKMTLVLHGTADLICTREGMQSLKARLPRGYLVYIWDAAHAIEIDQPERMLGVTLDFLSKSEAFVVTG
jgi:pimeloyl-ACP methyl ester carboxylesterase